MSTNYCCNNNLNTTCGNYYGNALGGSYLWIIVILVMFTSNNRKNCSFWDGYGNAFASSGFNNYNFNNNNNNNSNSSSNNNNSNFSNILGNS